MFSVIATKVLAWLGLMVVLLVSLHWALGAHLRRKGRAGGKAMRWVGALFALLERSTAWFDPQKQAELRRQSRQERARQHHDAIARSSMPMPFDDTVMPSKPKIVSKPKPKARQKVQWEGNVARPRFGSRDRSSPHNLH
jgi:hypothetical protein